MKRLPMEAPGSQARVPSLLHLQRSPELSTMTQERKGSPFLVFFTVFLPLWLCLAPIAILIWCSLLPTKIASLLQRRRPATPSSLTTTVHTPVEGTTPYRTLFFIHGWPDSGNLWKPQVEYFTQHGYTCVVATLPGYGGEGDSCIDFDQLLALLGDEVRRHTAPGKRLVLVGHDWGCVLAYLLAEREPALVSHVVALDVGMKTPETPSFRFFFVSYQLFNVFMYLLGHPAGTWATRRFLALMRYRARPLLEVRADLNYLYFQFWRRWMTTGRLDWSRAKVEVPIFFAYGRYKVEMFHTAQWLAELEADRRNSVQEYDCDHWITVHRSSRLNREVHEWLQWTALYESEAVA
eukprot:EG_transcript_12311